MEIPLAKSSFPVFLVILLSLSQCLSLQTRFVLVDTHHAGNVGAAARALRIDELVLVHPRDAKVLRRERTKQAASGAMNVIDKCQIYDTLADALEGIDVSCGTGMPHDMSRTRSEQLYTEPRLFMESLMKENNTMQSIAFVFGNEKMGMEGEDMASCNVILGIPTNPQFGSLNLASAVQIIAYDWRQALGGFGEEAAME
ncbi:RNA methyltransferase, TrmH family protein [Nitzschia inconspicua]|uniref:RNA methyltransferase, TrmH family protein n=1 Tax=Nitzschia inconspicua TaxID=303405 RepID=A0A9K3KS97_9STRA|nr:RNA methyltransferase, TrmH family protein [Nitzschia inconspicua]KAG7348285.1 RNA methyltransferase, TrmH family protein [Nitzschia inconspicua]